jgi:hypothetical protein
MDGSDSDIKPSRVGCSSVVACMHFGVVKIGDYFCSTHTLAKETGTSSA